MHQRLVQRLAAGRRPEPQSCPAPLAKGALQPLARPNLTSTALGNSFPTGACRSEDRAARLGSGVSNQGRVRRHCGRAGRLSGRLPAPSRPVAAKILDHYFQHRRLHLPEDPALQRRPLAVLVLKHACSTLGIDGQLYEVYQLWVRFIACFLGLAAGHQIAPTLLWTAPSALASTCWSGF